ncbi:hypothetical protein [Enhygromyxa salina]|uniref:hypothetical protein n=1 Tax=Enhygromyxa salina TaxID=215803 RepID=UPI0011B26984|nr:hypothetical protein [Enhygromyxa salina]
MQQAVGYYLSGDPVHNVDGYRRAAVLLSWIEFGTRAVHGAPPIEGRSLEDQETLDAVYLEARARLAQLSQGLDVFGNAEDYAPAASFEFYRRSLAERLALLGTIERAYATYFAELANHRAARAALEDGRRQAETLAGQHEFELEQADKDFADLRRRIDALHNDSLTLRSQLEQRLSQFRGAIERVGGCGLTDLFAATGTLSFLPMMGGGGRGAKLGAALMISHAAGDLIARDQRYASVGHGSVPRELLLGQLDFIGEDFASLADGYQAHRDHISIDDPYGQKLLMMQQQFDATFQQYADVVEARAARRAMRDYVDIIVRRNGLVMELNELASRRLELQGSITQLAVQARGIGHALASSVRMDLPHMTAFMAQLYRGATHRAIRHIYLASRAFSFWALADFPLLYQALRLDAPNAIDHGVLSAAAAKVLDAYQDAVEAIGSLPQRFPDAAARSRTKPRGVFVPITEASHPDELETFRNTGEILVNLRPVTPTTSVAESPFAGLANIRLTDVRARIEGARTSDNRLYVRIEHSGAEVIVGRDGQSRSFHHAPVAVVFRYRLDTGAIEIDGTIGSASPTTPYATIGPFTLWRVSVPRELNHDLQLSAVSHIELDFWGACHTFI